MEDIKKSQSISELRSVYDMMSLKGKKALVTGAAGGIGRTTATALAEVGADVALMDIPAKQDLLEKYCQEIANLHNVRTIPVTGDVSTPDAVAAFMDEIEKEFGTLHVIHNNAGVALPEDHSDISYETYNQYVAINQTGVLLVMQAGANLMKKNGNGGSIINTASISAHIINRGRPGIDRNCPGYPSVKAAVKHMTRAMAAEYIDDNIRVNSISPGYIVSGLHDDWDVGILEWFASTVPMERLGQLDELMGVIVYLASDLSTYATGTDIIIDGGYTIW
jgi:NAD(P)-dependent dehydrogenase (short-subunit alcohol dehydrogenase family)